MNLPKVRPLVQDRIRIPTVKFKISKKRHVDKGVLKSRTLKKRDRHLKRNFEIFMICQVNPLIIAPRNLL